ncbi:MAG: AMP-binding protein, partial [Lentisphaerae bacterium]|nr:AMP-binding protein [Lentisphaerota bacterium]
MHHRFILAAKKYAGKIAISDRSLKKTLSYRETLIAALALSAHFSKLPPGYVGVMLPTSAAAFLTCIGLQFSGRVPVMINYSTGSIKNCKLAKSKIGLKNIIASRALLEKLDVEPITEMSFIEDILSGLTAYDKLKATARSLLPATTLIKSLPHADENDDLVILFTSGSEKEPRAVRLTHRNIATNSEDTATVLRLTSDDTILCMLPVFHSFGHMANFWLPLVMGMRAVTYANPLDYKTIPKICREEEVTMIASTPIFFAGYLKESKPGDFKTVKI